MRADIHRDYTLKIFERQVKFFGVEISEFKYLFIEVLAMILAPSLVDLFQIDIGGWFYMFMAAAMLATLVLLRRLAKHRYKNYITDVISFRAKQPRLVRAGKKNG